MSSPPSITRPAVMRCHPALRLRKSFQAKAQMMAAITGCSVFSAVLKLGMDWPLRQSSLRPSTIKRPGSRKQMPLISPPTNPR